MRMLLFTILLSITYLGLGQEDVKADSLQNVIDNNTNASEVLESQFLLGEHLVQRNPEKAEAIAKNLQEQLGKIKDSTSWARLNYIYAASHRWQGNYTSALEYYNSNHHYFFRIKDSINIAKSSHFIGSINTFLGNNVLAQKHLLEAAEIYEIKGEPKQIARINNSLAGFHLNMDQLENGKDRYLIALDQFKVLNDSAGMSSANANLGYVYTELEEFEKAEKHLLLQKELNTVFPTLREMGFHHDFMGILRQAQGRNSDALKEHLTALEIREKLSSTYNLCESKLNMGNVLIKLGRYDEAALHLTDVLSFEEHESLNQQLSAYELLSEAAEKSGNYNSALNHYKEFKNISDSIYNKESLGIIAEKDASYKKKEQDVEIALLNKENEVTQTKLSRSRAILILSLIGLGVFSALAFSIYRQHQKIKLKNRTINKALQEKELLMREIHHRVKNNLQIISSLLNLQSKFIEDESALEAIQKGRNRVQSMALLHKNLYTKGDVTTVDIKAYLDNLVKNIFNSYNLKEDDIKLRINVDDVKLDVDTVIPIGLIINELITNSLKHAFTDVQKEHAQIDILLRESKEQLKLTVSDNGKGVANENMISAKDETFGQRMIDAFVKKLKATMKVNNTNGTEVIIEIPKPALGS